MPQEEAFLQQCSALGQRILAIPNLPHSVGRIFKEATPLLTHINGKRAGIQLDLIYWDHFSEENTPLHLKSLYVPTLLQILHEVGAEIRANQRVSPYWSLGNSFHRIDWRYEDAIAALFPDYPRLAMNAVIKPANSITTGELQKSTPTLEDILARKDSVVRSLQIIGFCETDELMPMRLKAIEEEIGVQFE